MSTEDEERPFGMFPQWLIESLMKFWYSFDPDNHEWGAGHTCQSSPAGSDAPAWMRNCLVYRYNELQAPLGRREYAWGWSLGTGMEMMWAFDIYIYLTSQLVEGTVYCIRSLSHFKTGCRKLQETLACVYQQTWCSYIVINFWSSSHWWITNVKFIWHLLCY